jgi:2-hydroxymuconate-semialdehyde hydrolase
MTTLGAQAMADSRYVSVDGVTTHYLEDGSEHRGRKPTMVLLHSAEYGGAAEITWEFNIGPLAKHYHVLAPDHLGFGRTDKVHDFANQFNRRVTHIRRFIETMMIDGPVHVMGSSMSGGMCLTVAARARPDWNIAKLVCCSGGGDAPDNDARKVINSYDGDLDHMRRIVDVMFVDPRWANDTSYIKRRHEMANMPGAWEATSAARFKAPFRVKPGPSERDTIDYAAIKCPVLVFAGRQDTLRRSGYTDTFVPKIPTCELHVFETAGHMGQIECAAEFNTRVLAFLAT